MSKKSWKIIKGVNLLKCKLISHKSLGINAMMCIFLIINGFEQVFFFLRTQCIFHFFRKFFLVFFHLFGLRRPPWRPPSLKKCELQNCEFFKKKWFFFFYKKVNFKNLELNQPWLSVSFSLSNSRSANCLWIRMLTSSRIISKWSKFSCNLASIFLLDNLVL